MGDKIIRVDMSSKAISIDDFPDDWRLLGGRGLSAKILLAECDPSCDPLGPDNVLVLAPGVLAGTSAPTSGRISVGCKSPLTGGIKEANVGGIPGQDLMKLGFRGIVVKGQPSDPERRYASVDAPAGPACITDPAAPGLVACGDWCLGARVESAVLSGIAAAEIAASRRALYTG